MVAYLGSSLRMTGSREVFDLRRIPFIPLGGVGKYEGW